MTTATSYVPDTPAGADWVDEWTGEGKDRGRFFRHPSLDVGDAILTIQGVQYADGKTGRSILIRVEPAFENGTDGDLTPLYARKLAAWLQNLADQCEMLDSLPFIP
jgi:hypothetical protein